jgi:predicted nuclease of predicted toxin-antitoxin system
MEFKIDENLPIEVAGILRASGHDARTIHDQQMVGKPDPGLALVCQSERRALITLDLDFADIRAYPPGDHPGIIVLRPLTQSKPSVVALVEQRLPLIEVEPLHGRLWIVQENGLRIRES